MNFFFSSKNAHTLIGTCNYVAPEICDGKPYDIKSDIWSLGCILYEMCAMERMFEGTVINLKMLTHKFTPIFQIYNVVLAIAARQKKMIDVNYYGIQMQQIIELMLQIEPNDRPDTAALMSLSDVFPSLHVLGTHLGCIPKSQKFDFQEGEVTYTVIK